MFMTEKVATSPASPCYEVNPTDLYVFDSIGLLVVRNVLSSEAVETAKDSLANAHNGQKKPWKFPVLDAGEIFWDMMVNPTMLCLVSNVCGEFFRMDHAFGVTSENLVVNLHGGPNCSSGSCFSSVDNGTLVSQLSAGFALYPQSPSTGGLCYIPGSHKSKDTRDGRTVKKELLNGNLNHDCIVVPTINAGDLVMFSESLIHGDSGWSPTDYHRTMIYYKFCPGFICWRDPKEQDRYLPLARTALERRLLERPWSGSFSDLNNTLDMSNKRREKTL